MTHPGPATGHWLHTRSKWLVSLLETANLPAAILPPQPEQGLSLGLRIPIIDVNHLHGHVLAHFVRESPDDVVPNFPFLCLLISGGNSQLVLVRAYNDMEILGQTIDDAAGEAFDKCAINP